MEVGSTATCPHPIECCGWFPRVSPCLGLAQSQINKYFPRERGCGPQRRQPPVLLGREGPEKGSLSGLSQGPPSPAQGDPVSACLSWGTGRLESLPIQPAPKGPAFLLWALRWGKGLGHSQSCFSSSSGWDQEGGTCFLLIKGPVSLQLSAEQL